MNPDSSHAPRVFDSIWNPIVIITGLGFFIDSYDFFLYNAMRQSALTELGFEGETLTRVGIYILNTQIVGALVGSVIFGVIGDKAGRKRGLVWSIVVYSLGMLVSAAAQDAETLAAGRFLTGLGTAGEIGVGATLVSETVSSRHRTYSLAFFTLLGTLGASAAAVSIQLADWRICCLAGALAGAGLLFFRTRLFESPLFLAGSPSAEKKGSIRELFGRPHHLKSLLWCTFILVPNFFITGMLLTLSPEISRALGSPNPVKANLALAAYFTVAAMGDLVGAWISNALMSRKIVVALFVTGNMAAAIGLLACQQVSVPTFYSVCAALGLCNLWAISGTVTVEHFPTHLRSLASSIVYSLARASIVLMTISFLLLKRLGTLPTLTLIACFVSALALIGTLGLRETYGSELKSDSFS